MDWFKAYFKKASGEISRLAVKVRNGLRRVLLSPKQDESSTSEEPEQLALGKASNEDLIKLVKKPAYLMQ